MSKKSFCILQIMIAVMVIVAILANTYAWADRGSKSGNKLSLDYKSSVNGSTVTAVTRIVGSEEIIDFGAEYNVSVGELLRFETVLTNTGAVPCNVSLFLKEATCVVGFTVRVSEPMTEYHEYNDAVRGWVRVLSSCQIEAYDTVVLHWSIELASASRFSISGIVLEHF